MMDAVKEISQWQPVEDTNKKPCMDAESQQHSPMVDAVSKVLDDDNLLMEIIICVNFPTTLVHAALVCKRWYYHVSDREFLGRFRKRHPPRLLGIYVANKLSEPKIPYFVPMLPQPQELATMARRVASYNFGTHADESIMGCENGSVFTRRCNGSVLKHGVHHPLCPERDMYILPPLPSAHDLGKRIFDRIISEDGGGGLSYLYVLGTQTNETKKFTVRVYMLQGSVWHIHASVDQLDHLRPVPKVILVNNKLYMWISVSHEIIVLDLVASSIFTIQLPQGVSYYSFNTSLTRAGDASSVCFIHVNDDLQLCIWLHKGDNWLLVYTICLHQMWANMRVLDHTLQDRRVLSAYIIRVADNVEFVFLQMCGYILYLDVTSRSMCTVYKTAEKDQHLGVVYPFMICWPPIFPALKDDHARNTT